MCFDCYNKTEIPPEPPAAPVGELEGELKASKRIIRDWVGRIASDGSQSLRGFKAIMKVVDEKDQRIDDLRSKIETLRSQRNDYKSISEVAVATVKEQEDEIDKVFESHKTCGEISCDECNERFAALVLRVKEQEERLEKTFSSGFLAGYESAELDFVDYASFDKNYTQSKELAIKLWKHSIAKSAPRSSLIKDDASESNTK